jgi:hypothetical protein
VTRRIWIAVAAFTAVVIAAAVNVTAALLVAHWSPAWWAVTIVLVAAGGVLQAWVAVAGPAGGEDPAWRVGREQLARTARSAGEFLTIAPVGLVLLLACQGTRLAVASYHGNEKSFCLTGHDWDPWLFAGALLVGAAWLACDHGRLGWGILISFAALFLFREGFAYAGGVVHSPPNLSPSPVHILAWGIGLVFAALSQMIGAMLRGIAREVLTSAGEARQA